MAVGNERNDDGQIGSGNKYSLRGAVRGDFWKKERIFNEV